MRISVILTQSVFKWRKWLWFETEQNQKQNPEKHREKQRNTEGKRIKKGFVWDLEKAM